MSSNRCFYLASTAEPSGADAGSSWDPLEQTPNSRTEANGLVDPETQSTARHEIQPQLDTGMKPLSSLSLEGDGEAREGEGPYLSHAVSWKKSLYLLCFCTLFTNPHPCTKGKCQVI